MFDVSHQVRNGTAGESRLGCWQQRRLAAAPALLWLVVISCPALPAFAQTCSSRGTPTVPAPQVTYLRHLVTTTTTPQALATDPDGRLYVCDAKAGVLEVRDRYGRLQTRWVGLQQPVAVAADGEGRIFVAEAAIGAVRIFDLAGIGAVQHLGKGEEEFAFPTAVAVAPRDKLVFVADGGDHTVKVYAPTGAWLQTLGGPGSTAGRFFFPAGLAVNSHRELLVVDQGNARVQVFDLAGNFLRCFGRAGGMGTSRLLVRAAGVTADAMDRTFVVDTFQDQLRVFDPQGPALGTLGTLGEAPGELFTPVSAALDPFNRLFVASPNTGRVEIYGIDTFQDPHAVSARVEVRPDTVPLARKGLTLWLTIVPEVGDARDLVPETLLIAGRPPLRLATTWEQDAQGVWLLRVLVQFELPSQSGQGSELTIPVALEFRDGVPVEGVAVLKTTLGGRT